MGLKEYLYKEFTGNTIKKYYKYFDEGISNLTNDQVLYYKSYMNGQKSPYVN